MTDEIRELGAELVAISPQLPEHSREFREERSLPFPVLSDPGNETARRYGLVWTLPDELRELYRQFGTDLSEYNGDDTWQLPLPARFIVDEAGVIRHAEASADYTVRPEPADTVARLRELVEG